MLSASTHFVLRAPATPGTFPFKVSLAGFNGTASYQAAIYTPGTHLMNPAALTRGLSVTLPSNVDLFENSPVTHGGKKI